MAGELSAIFETTIGDAYRSCLDRTPASIEVSTGSGVVVAVLRGVLDHRERSRMRSGRSGEVRRGRRAARDLFGMAVQEAMDARFGTGCHCAVGEVGMDDTMTVTITWTA